MTRQAELTAGIDVIVCTHDEKRLPALIACTTAINEQLDPQDRLIVVVDSSERLADRVGAAVDADLVCCTRAPSGLSHARNIGIGAGTNPMIAFVDDDAVPRDGWLAAIRSAAQSDVAVVAGAVDPVWPTGRRPAWFPGTFDWTVGCDYTGICADGAPVRNPIGANMAIARHVFDRVGLFDARLGRHHQGLAGAEETELAIRASADDPNLSMIRIGSARVDHYLDKNRCRRRYLLRRAHDDGRSKAQLAQLAASGHGSLSAEFRHVAWTIPSDCVREIYFHRNGFAMALQYTAMAFAATCCSAIGFARGSMSGAVATFRARR